MTHSHTLFPFAANAPQMMEDLHVMQEMDKVVPDSFHLSIRRYKKQLHWNLEDMGKVVYTVDKAPETENSLELIFCVSGNKYCHSKNMECDACKENASSNCNEKTESVDIISCTFSASYLKSQVKGVGNLFADKVLSFKHPGSFSRTLPICAKTRNIVDALMQHNYTGTFENLFYTAQVQLLLLNSMECLIGEKEEPVFICKFLSNEADREKIALARNILIEHIGNPITIKALSRKVAMNECYLKKGFKEVFGSTIFEFYQNQRMDHAKYLLYDKGLSVTEVSMSLGYSSISHFSTAFKKHTGLKPCELLLR